MSSHIKKIEHCGAKHGKSYWGTKREAKELSRKERRKQDKKLSKGE